MMELRNGKVPGFKYHSKYRGAFDNLQRAKHFALLRQKLLIFPDTV